MIYWAIDILSYWAIDLLGLSYWSIELLIYWAIDLFDPESTPHCEHSDKREGDTFALLSSRWAKQLTHSHFWALDARKSWYFRTVELPGMPGMLGMPGARPTILGGQPHLPPIKLR